MEISHNPTNIFGGYVPEPACVNIGICPVKETILNGRPKKPKIAMDHLGAKFGSRAT